MWSPGSLLWLRGYQCHHVGVKPNDDAEGRHVYPPLLVALVISIRETGYGTRGKKFDALVIADGRLVTWVNAWREVDRIECHG